MTSDGQCALGFDDGDLQFDSEDKLQVMKQSEMLCIWEVSQWSTNKGTWYPTGFRKPYQVNVTDMPI
eukprot:2136670-Pleurochrysis_carterae.AAC.1